MKTNPSEACSLGLHIDPSDQDRVMMLLTGVWLPVQRLTSPRDSGPWHGPEIPYA